MAPNLSSTKAVEQPSVQEVAIEGINAGVPEQFVNSGNVEKVALSPKPPKETTQQGEEEDYEPAFLLKFLLCAVAALEGADNLLMPATMYALQESAGIQFTDLVYLGGIQAICANIAGPLWGSLADRRALSRRTILIIGSLGQGIVTVMLAFITSLTPMIFLRGLNGVMLASLRPVSNGIVADTTSESRRGKIFGQVQAAMIMGMLFTSLCAIPIANKEVIGFAGWRVAFVLVGSLSLIVWVLLQVLFVDPIKVVEKTTAKGFRAVLEELRSVLQFFKIPTFSVMIMQGIFGTIPWSVLGYMTLFFQLSGLSDVQAMLLSTEQLVIGIFGNMLGGYVSDSLAKRCGYHGRPFNAQITVSVGIMLIGAMFWAIPAGEGDFGVYFGLLFLWALLGCWAQSGTNFPILCEIVPANARTRVLAWECCLENTVASALAPPIVAFVAKWRGYSFGGETTDDTKLDSATALGESMVIINTVPGLVCLCAYTLLHWSYPRDIKRLQAQGNMEQAK